MMTSPPFSTTNALDKHLLHAGQHHVHAQSDDGTIRHVPDQPSIGLTNTEVQRFLAAELETTILDRMYDWLWLCAAKNSEHVDALNVQLFKGRSVLATEDPALHLVWFKGKICVKPVPPALLNYDFWTRYLSTQDGSDNSRQVALGFMRSYSHLIRHRSDLAIAVTLGLVPETVDWMAWDQFITPFRHISDSNVAQRYHFGQLRLSRLNLLIRVLRPRGARDRGNNRHYYTMYWYTSAYLRQFVEAGIFVFASLSLIFSAMQVIMSLPAGGPSPAPRSAWTRHSPELSQAFWGFSVTVLLALAVGWFLLLVAPVGYTLIQQLFGYRQKRQFERDMARTDQIESAKLDA